MKPAEAVLDEETGCWRWHGRKDKYGYGTITVHGHTLQAHRVIWEAERATLTKGTQLDHLCRRRDCVRPAHLEPVTSSENNRRKLAWNRRKIVYCPANHLLAETGIETPEGGRICRICSGVPDVPSQRGKAPLHNAC